MSGLVISYSGVRGVVGGDLDPSVARRFGVAFRRMVTELHPTGPVTLVVGRDTRASGPALRDALAGNPCDMHFIWFLIVGAVVGLLGRLIHPGRDPMGLLLTVAIAVRWHAVIWQVHTPANAR